MSVARRFASLVLAAFCCLVALGLPAQAAPYPDPPRIICTLTFNGNRFVLSCELRNFTPRAPVNVVLHSDPVDLGTVRVDSKGNKSLSHTVAKSFAKSTHTVIGTDTKNSSDSARTTVVFGPASKSGLGLDAAAISASGGTGTGTGSSGTGLSTDSASASGLSSTGVAVLGIGGAGVVLLAAGGMLLLSGRRRRTAA